MRKAELAAYLAFLGVTSKLMQRHNTMPMQKPHKYHLRPGYGSEELLLEFFPDSSESQFINDLMNTLKGINPFVDAVEDLWMNDEIVFQVSSDVGSFVFTKDNWGFAFIMADNNQLAIKCINEILKSSKLFVKEEVDFEKYKDLKT